MRTYILTPKERLILHDYLKDSNKTVSERVLLHRIKVFLPNLKEDLELLDAVYKKAER